MLGNLVVVTRKQGNLEEATTLGRRALAIYEKGLGPEHPAVATALSELSDTLIERGEIAQARACLERALAIAEKLVGTEDADLAYPLTELGDVHRRLVRADDAVTAAERAVRLRAAAPGDPTLLALSRFTLARALAAARRDPAQARALAEQARDAYRSAGKGSEQKLAEVVVWLEARAAE